MKKLAVLAFSAFFAAAALASCSADGASEDTYSITESNASAPLVPGAGIHSVLTDDLPAAVPETGALADIKLNYRTVILAPEKKFTLSATGVADADASHAADKLEKLGRPLSRREEAACYQPMKALCACLIVFGVPLVLGAYLAATAEPYTYALQDLPSWLTGTYGAREDVMAPLAAYAQTASVSARDIIRLIVRLTVLVYINLFPDPQTMAQLVDQLTPLMVLSYPVACMIGYLRAPAVYAKRQSMQRRAKKAAVRKAQKKSMVSELLGSGGDVHYGQRPQQEEHKKKELI